MGVKITQCSFNKKPNTFLLFIMSFYLKAHVLELSTFSRKKTTHFAIIYFVQNETIQKY